jgi:hypothetical protein
LRNRASVFPATRERGHFVTFLGQNARHIFSHPPRWNLRTSEKSINDQDFHFLITSLGRGHQANGTTAFETASR